MPSLKACTLAWFDVYFDLSKKASTLTTSIPDSPLACSRKNGTNNEKSLLWQKENCIKGDTINVLLMKGLTWQKQGKRNRNSAVKVCL